MSYIDDFREMKAASEELERKQRQSMKKQQLIGLIGTALIGAGGHGMGQAAGGVARQNLDAQEQKNMIEIEGLKNDYLMKIQAQEMDMRAKQMDMQMKAMQADMDMRMKEEDYNRKRTEGILKQNREGKEWAFKYDTGEREAAINYLDKFRQKLGDLPIVGETVGKASEYLAGKVQQAIPKAEKIRETLPVQEAQIKAAGEVGSEAINETMQDLGILTPEQQEAKKQIEKERKQADMLFDQTYKSNEQTISRNARLEAMGDEKGMAFMDYLDNGKFDKPYSPEAQEYAMKEVQDYKAREKQMRLMGGGGGGGGGGTKPAPSPDQSMWNISSVDWAETYTGDEQKFLTRPLRDIVKANDVQSLADLVYNQVVNFNANPDNVERILADVMSYDETKQNPFEPLWNESKDLAPYLKNKYGTDWMIQGKGGKLEPLISEEDIKNAYLVYQSDNLQADVLALQSKGINPQVDAKTNSMLLSFYDVALDEGFIPEKGGWVKPNMIVRAYESSPKNFVNMLLNVVSQGKQAETESQKPEQTPQEIADSLNLQFYPSEEIR